MEGNNELMLMDDNNKFVVDLTSPTTTSYCSLSATSEKDKKMIFNAINNPTGRLSDFINMPLEVANVYAECVECVNRDTGEMKICPRIVFINTKGESFTAVSLGVYGALKKVFGIFGTPENWEKPLTIIPKQISKGEYKVLTFEIK